MTLEIRALRRVTEKHSRQPIGSHVLDSRDVSGLLRVIQQVSIAELKPLAFACVDMEGVA